MHQALSSQANFENLLGSAFGIPNVTLTQQHMSTPQQTDQLATGAQQNH